jgi:DNA-binding MarR family transcriptional regulator
VSDALSPAEVARLYFALGRLSQTVRRDAPDALVGHSGLSVLATLITQGVQRAGALAETEGIAAPVMTRILNSLEDQGYVVRRPDPADRRASLVEVTDTGRDLVLSGRAVRLQAMQRRLAALSEDERATLLGAVPVLESLGENT